jgi:hypothetical protein
MLSEEPIHEVVVERIEQVLSECVVLGAASCRDGLEYLICVARHQSVKTGVYHLLHGFIRIAALFRIC